MGVSRSNSPLAQYSNGNSDDVESSPFLSLEAPNSGGPTTHPADTQQVSSSQWFASFPSFKFPSIKISGKKVVSYIMFGLVGIIIWESLFTAPENKLIKPEEIDDLFRWVQIHPGRGGVAILLVIAAAVVVMVPVGTPLTLGCGFIFKRAYGWRLGFTIATLVSMGGSALGAVTCFLLGRYLMRDEVRKWIKKYPIFVAIDVASAEHGLRIMAMLYLTPVLPLGPVSYMCGTTSMPLSSFVMAKVASFPLMGLYVFIGASMGALIGKSAEAEIKAIEQNSTLIVSGILLSFVTIFTITYYIRKELNKILERQGKHKPGETDQTEEDIGPDEDTAIEMGGAASRRRAVA